MPLFSHPPGSYRDALKMWNSENFHGAIWAMPKRGFQAQKDVKTIQAGGHPEPKSIEQMAKKVEEPPKEEPKKMKAPAKPKAAPKPKKAPAVKAAIKKMIDNREKVEIPKKEFVKEHKKLVKVLESGTNEEQKKEAEKQEKEAEPLNDLENHFYHLEADRPAEGLRLLQTKDFKTLDEYVSSLQSYKRMLSDWINRHKRYHNVNKSKAVEALKEHSKEAYDIYGMNETELAKYANEMMMNRKLSIKSDIDLRLSHLDRWKNKTIHTKKIDTYNEIADYYNKNHNKEIKHIAIPDVLQSSYKNWKKKQTKAA